MGSLKVPSPRSEKNLLRGILLESRRQVAPLGPNLNRKRRVSPRMGASHLVSNPPPGRDKGLPLTLLYLSQGSLGLLGLLIIAHQRLWPVLLLRAPWEVVLGYGLGSGLALVLMFLGLYRFLLRFLSPNLWVDEVNLCLVELLTFPHVVGVTAITAVSEELLFRAALQTLAMRWLPAGWAIGFTSAVFALFHFRYWSRPILLVLAFVMGLVLGGLYWYTGSFWTGVASHFVYNFAIIILAQRGFFPREKEANRAGGPV